MSIDIRYLVKVGKQDLGQNRNSKSYLKLF